MTKKLYRVYGHKCYMWEREVEAKSSEHAEQIVMDEYENGVNVPDEEETMDFTIDGSDEIEQVGGGGTHAV